MKHHLRTAVLGTFVALAVALGLMATPASAHGNWDGDRDGRRGDVRSERHDRDDRRGEHAKERRPGDRHDHRDRDRRDRGGWDRRDRDRHDRDEVSAEDVAFLGTAAGIALTEIHEGNVAMQRGTNPLVQEYGRRMVVEHFVQLYDQLPMLRQHGVELPVLTEEQLARLTELTSTPEETFDGVYMALQIEGHEAAIELFESVADETDSRKVRKFAKAHLPQLHQHLDAARVIHGVVAAPAPAA